MSFKKVPAQFSSRSANCLHVPACRSHLTLDPSLFSSPLSLPSKTQLRPDGSSSVPRISICTNCKALLFHPCPSSSFLSYLRTTFNPTTDISKAETCKLGLAWVVLKGVTGAIWARVLVSAENARRKELKT